MRTSLVTVVLATAACSMLAASERVDDSLQISADSTLEAQLGSAVQLKDCTVLLNATATATEQFAAAELAKIAGNVSNGNVPLPLETTGGDLMGGAHAGGSAGCYIAVGYGASIAAGLQAGSVLEGLGDEGEHQRRQLTAFRSMLRQQLCAPT